MVSVKRLECYINRASLGTNELANNELGVTGYQFLKRIETEKGWITELAHNCGAGPGVNSNVGFHNDPSPVTAPFFAFFRWNTSARRTKESYFLYQFGVSPGINTGVGAPARVQGLNNPTVQGVGFSWSALLDNALVSQNPWNGSPATTKGTPVYKNAGVGETIFNLPLSNHAGGSFATNRENLCGVGTNTTLTTSLRVQMVADQDNILFQVGRDSVAQSWCFHLGAYIPLPGISAPFPIFMLNSFTTTSSPIFPTDGNVIGSTAGTAQYEGGICASAVHAMVLQANYPFLIDAGHQPNQNISGSAYDFEPVYVGKSGGGRLGRIDPDFLHAVGNLAWGSQLDAGAYAVLDAATAGRARANVIWDGATIAGSGTTRVGVDSST